MDENQLTTFIERLEAERKELDDKIEKLDAFRRSDKFPSIGATQMALLNIQSMAMSTYSQTLLERMTNLQKGE